MVTLAEPMGRGDPSLELTQNIIGIMDGTRIELRGGIEHMSALRGKTLELNEIEPRIV